MYCRIITEGIFGIRPTGLKSFTFTPRLPAEWNQMNLRNIKAFNSTFDIEVTRENGKQSVAVKAGGKTLLHKTFKEGEVISVKLP